ncbi:cytochrome c-type biogenesis protein CcmH [Chelatococcus reniformis]|uniref:Cytochrome c-type biogenesis protein n=2 Tax=Chelatococcus reniformis TaxID=1494448 RepID=A0A916UHZ1_9HYPH|nr:cytochrome c-type biogenesis protein CcmH [Chelatococcus reniformis]
MRCRRWGIAGVMLLAVTASLPAVALQPDEVLADRQLEARARDISAGLRCLVCQNQSIDDSDAPLARDLRLLVRERLQSGDSDRAVRDFVVSRYGDFVLLKPPFKLDTAILWASPLLVLLAGAVAIVIGRRTRRPPPPPDLSPAEQAKLDAILNEER